MRELFNIGGGSPSIRHYSHPAFSGCGPAESLKQRAKTPLQWATETPQSPRISTESNRAVTINLLSNSEMSHREQLDAGSKQKSEADNTVDVHESVGDSSKPNTPVDDVDRNAMESSNERLEDHPRENQ